MRQLYKIADEHQEIIKSIEEGQFTEDEMADTLEGAVGTFEEKAASVHAYTKGLDGDIESIEAEVKRLNSMKSALKNKKEQMRNYLKHNMQKTGINNIKCPLFSITLAKGRQELLITDESLIPDEYVDVEVIQKPDKKKLLSDLKDGLDIPGCEIQVSDQSLRIK